MHAESIKIALGGNTRGDARSVLLSIDVFDFGRGAGITHELGNCILDFGCCCKNFTSKDMVAIGAGMLYHEDLLLNHQVKMTVE